MNLFNINTGSSSNFTNKLSISLFVFVFLFACLGSFFIEYGVDYGNYIIYFDQIRNGDFNVVLLNRVEPLFGFIVFLLTMIFTSNYFVYFCLLILSIFFKLLVIFYRSQTFLSSITLSFYYLFRYFPIHELTQIRISIAIGFFLLAISMRTALLGWLLFAIACTVHYSIIPFMPLFVFVVFAQTESLKYLKYEKVIWVFIFFLIVFFGFFLDSILVFLTPYFSVLQIYAVSGFGDSTVSRFNARILLDVVCLLMALPLIRRTSFRMRFWLYVQIVGVLVFYSTIKLPIIAFRLNEIFGVLWIFYFAEALRNKGLVRIHALFFICLFVFAYLYFYFFAKSAIFPFLDR